MNEPDVVRTEERDFLLASLDDLDAEYAAGDLDRDDYEALRADYTTRAAAAIRAIEDDTPPPTPANRSRTRIVLWTLGIFVVAVLAGVWLAEFSGERGAGDSISGDIRSTTRQRLFEARQLLGDDPGGAMALYDEVLIDEPSSAEALAYRGWLANLAGERQIGQDFVERSVLADPAYPDARVFAASIALDLGDVDAAEAHLDSLDRLEVPAFIEQLVRAQGLRAAIIEARLLTGAPDAFASSGLRVDEVARSADSLLEAGEVARALALYDVLLAEARDDPEVATEAGWFLGRLALNAGPELASSMTTAEELLSEALVADEGSAAALIYRSFVRLWRDDLEGARADLAAYDALGAARADLELLIDETGLRAELA